jgi:hypothetical protein
MIDVGRICMNTTNLLSAPFSLGLEWPLQHAGIFLPIVVININIMHVILLVFHQGQINFGCHRWKQEAAYCTAILVWQTSTRVAQFGFISNKAKIIDLKTKLKIAANVRSNYQLFKRNLMQANARVRQSISNVKLYWNNPSITNTFLLYSEFNIHYDVSVVLTVFR